MENNYKIEPSIEVTRLEMQGVKNPTRCVEAEELALELMEQHNLLANGWTFEWHKRTSAFGTCYYTQKKIKLSALLIPLCTIEEVKDTILHEIAHALVGVGNNHNQVWKDKAVEIGCNGERCGKSVNLTSKFIGTCPVCKRQVFKNKRNFCSCSKCSNKFNKKYLIEWIYNPEYNN